MCEQGPRGKGASKGRTGAEQGGRQLHLEGTWGNARQEEGVRSIKVWWKMGLQSFPRHQEPSEVLSREQGIERLSVLGREVEEDGLKQGECHGEAPVVGHWINDSFSDRSKVEMKWRLRRNDLYSKANL